MKKKNEWKKYEKKIGNEEKGSDRKANTEKETENERVPKAGKLCTRVWPVNYRSQLTWQATASVYRSSTASSRRSGHLPQYLFSVARFPACFVNL
jgi:hypothetical protein